MFFPKVLVSERRIITLTVNCLLQEIMAVLLVGTSCSDRARKTKCLCICSAKICHVPARNFEKGFHPKFTFLFFSSSLISCARTLRGTFSLNTVSKLGPPQENEGSPLRQGEAPLFVAPQTRSLERATWSSSVVLTLSTKQRLFCLWAATLFLTLNICGSF